MLTVEFNWGSFISHAINAEESAGFADLSVISAAKSWQQPALIVHTALLQ